MGNQTSKDGLLIDNTNQRRIRPSMSSVKTSPAGNLNKQDYQQLENSRIVPSKSSRLLPKKQQQKKQAQQQQQSKQHQPVSPIRHQLVLTDHVTPLVSLSAASSFNVYQQQRRSSAATATYRDTRSMSSTSITSEEGEPNTPTHLRSSYDEFAHSFMNDIHSQHYQQQKKLSSSLPVKYSDGFIINTTTPTSSTPLHSFDQINRRRETKEVWVYEYGAEKERDRQTRQHYVLKQVFKNNLHVQLVEPTKILESACGVGLWSLEIAHDNPNCQVIGIDVVPPSEKEGWNLATVSSFNTSSSLSAGQLKRENNVKFQYGDILQTLMFPDNHFDLVYQRDVATVLPFKLWPNLISEFFRVTKFGGQIQLVEYDLLFKSPGPVLTQVNEWYRSAAATIGVNPDYTHHITEYMEDAGFVDVQVKVYDIPIGEWPETDLEKQQGYLYKEQMRALFKSMKRWWCSEIKVSQQEYDQVCAEAMEEFEEFRSSARWKIFTARKP
ncbi:unnamed protein product [Mucor fragilis]